MNFESAQEMTKTKQLTTKAPRRQDSVKSKSHNPTSQGAFLSVVFSTFFLVSWCLGGAPLIAYTIFAALVAPRVRADSTPNFNSQVAPILQKNCLACHSSASKMGGLVMENYDALMKGGAHGVVIVPGKAGPEPNDPDARGKGPTANAFRRRSFACRGHCHAEGMDR